MEKIVELTTRVFSDKCPGDVFDSIVVFALTSDNYEDVIEHSAKIYLQKKTPVIISGADTISGYVGVNKYKGTLTNLGVDTNDVLIAPPVDNKMLHTRNESQAYVRFLNQQKLSKPLVVTAPFHQLRAFMTMVTVALEEKVNIKLYNCPVANYDWNKTVTHSQGLLTKAASELIHEELDRIGKYHQKGDLESVKNVLGYLNTRDID